MIRDPRDVDVVHLISPDAVIGGPRTAAAERLRRATAFAVHVQRRRIALVQTLVGQGVRSPAEQVLDRVTTAFIARDGHQSTPDASRTRVIPHSHLRDRFLGYPRARAIAGRAVMVAPATLDAAYEAPVKVFAAADIPGSSLRIVGRAPAPLAASFARSAGRSGERVVIRDESLSDAERVAEITASEFVVIAAPETLESHATLLLAVSLGRPVLVEETPATAALAAEIGAEWVRTHPGRLTIARLEDAVASLNGAIPTHDPRLDDRAPNVVASMYRDLYRDAVNSVIR
ncbi:hypothetical protein [Microbacterium sp.]|uniref:hypothetical protein n=1 Tax=Microbacterium sp. TaxID=51671 RepID=UPI003734EA7E